MNNDETLQVANEIVRPHGLCAEFLGDPDTVRSVGVGGDFQSFTPIIVLIGSRPGDEVLASVATGIGNRTGVNRVTFQLRYVPPEATKP